MLRYASGVMFVSRLLQDLEVLLAGSLRREKTSEETIAQQAADIEQLSRLV